MHILLILLINNGLCHGYNVCSILRDIFMTNFGQNTSIHAVKRCLCYTLDILTTYLWYGKTKSQVNDIHKRFKWKIQNYQINFQVSPRKFAFLDAMLHKDENNNIHTNLYRKPTDQLVFLHAKSEHPRSL